MLEIIRNTLNNLKTKNISITPENYCREFYTLSKDSDVQISEIENLNYLLQNLDTSEHDTIQETIKTHYDLANTLSNRVKKSEVLRFFKHVGSYMRPSIDPSINYELDQAILELSKDAHNLSDEIIIKKLSSITEKRIIRDRLALKNKSQDIIKITTLIDNFFEKAMSQNNHAKDDVIRLSTDIKNVTENEIIQLKSDLEVIIDNFQRTLDDNQDTLEQGQQQNIHLKDKIAKLEKSLLEIEEEKNIDFLTAILNRRGFTEEIQRFENEYDVFAKNYSIVFFDIDHFKDVNDQHGHDCGDSVLTSFASLLKKLTRVDDIVARYGGEEFVALVHYKDKSEVTRYLNRVRSVIDGYKFIYKNIKIKISYSAGVTFRENFKNFDDALKQADTKLYEAKESGRHAVIIDDEVYR